MRELLHGFKRYEILVNWPIGPDVRIHRIVASTPDKAWAKFARQHFAACALKPDRQSWCIREETAVPA